MQVQTQQNAIGNSEDLRIKFIFILFDQIDAEPILQI